MTGEQRRGVGLGFWRLGWVVSGLWRTQDQRYNRLLGLVEDRGERVAWNLWRFWIVHST